MPPHRPYTERFWSFVTIKRGACWDWNGALDKQGYGRLSDRSIPSHFHRAHRVSYEIAYGPILPGLLVLHRCDRPQCVNPAHLFLGTNGDNARDMVSKNRHAKGSIRGRAKLKEEDIPAIRALQGLLSSRKVAQRYGVAKYTIQLIWQRRNWNHIP